MAGFLPEHLPISLFEPSPGRQRVGQTGARYHIDNASSAQQQRSLDTRSVLGLALQQAIPYKLLHLECPFTAAINAVRGTASLDGLNQQYRVSLLLCILKVVIID